MMMYKPTFLQRLCKVLASDPQLLLAILHSPETKIGREFACGIKELCASIDPKSFRDTPPASFFLNLLLGVLSVANP